MSEPALPVALLVGATALHAGFQATVTVLVYPALARTPPEQWSAVHARHSRSIVPLVAVVYAAVVASGALVLLRVDAGWAWAAVLLGAVAVLVTAFLAAPLHGRLASPDPALLRRLLRVDRLRAAAAVLSLVLAVVASATG